MTEASVTIHDGTEKKEEIKMEPLRPWPRDGSATAQTLTALGINVGLWINKMRGPDAMITMRGLCYNQECTSGPDGKRAGIIADKGVDCEHCFFAEYCSEKCRVAHAAAHREACIPVIKNGCTMGYWRRARETSTGATRLLERSVDANNQRAARFALTRKAYTPDPKFLDELLLRAIACDFTEVMHVLLQHRGDGPLKMIPVPGFCPMPPLAVAALCGSSTSVAWLCKEHKADANGSAMAGWTPLALSCLQDKKEITSMLIHHGASRNDDVAAEILALRGDGERLLHLGGKFSVHVVRAAILSFMRLNASSHTAKAEAMLAAVEDTTIRCNSPIPTWAIKDDPMGMFRTFVSDLAKARHAKKIEEVAAS